MMRSWMLESATVLFATVAPAASAPLVVTSDTTINDVIQDADIQQGTLELNGLSEGELVVGATARLELNGVAEMVRVEGGHAEISGMAMTVSMNGGTALISGTVQEIEGNGAVAVEDGAKIGEEIFEQCQTEVESLDRCARAPSDEETE